MVYLPRDFIETGAGLIFAVVDPLIEDGKVLCFLRYGREGKLSTGEGNAWLSEHQPAYLHHSTRLDAPLHAVPVADIRAHHRPRERVRALLTQGPGGPIEEKLLRLLDLLMENGQSPDCLGVTGSLLIGRQSEASDLDMVIYGREHFFGLRAWVRQLMAAGRLGELDQAAWREAYDRRGCELGFEEFLRHERRKGNKGMIAGTKFDLALIVEEAQTEPHAVWRKSGSARIRARVLDDDRAFDQPARYLIDHPEIGEVLSFTHTYVGQAQTGEIIEAAGMMESSDDGRFRLIVGSSREAPGEFIRVLA
ncbi:MAG: hypothetical protein PHE55_04940 [Methylococcaceae bacterium]|nr:hypothetical protein [Methylococcaceae bacterium]